MMLSSNGTIFIEARAITIIPWCGTKSRTILSHDRDKAEKFAAANIPGVASGDIRDLFSPGAVRYFIPQKTDKTHKVCDVLWADHSRFLRSGAWFDGRARPIITESRFLRLFDTYATTLK
jgi:hypothetical protein